MPRWNGGVIGAANNPTSSSAKGIWSLSEATKAIRAGLWPPSNAGSDPYFENVTLLLPGDGTNGAQNNTFLDSSTNNFTITRNGNTTQGTFTPFSKADGRWGNYFGGSQSISAAASTDFQFAGDFTIESWVYPTTTGADNFFIQNSGSNYFAVNVNAGTGFEVFLNSSTPTFSPTDIVPPLNQWSHIALVRSGSTVKLYLNGTASTTTATNSSTLGYNAIFYVGAFGTSSSGPFVGYASNFRAVNGTAVYTANFTAPTAPLSAITNTKLLTCQSNRFIDNSSGAKAITVNGSPQITTFSPFPTLTAYAAGTNGGSGYFDGSGDYLTIPSDTAFNFGTGAFSVEFWVYITSLAENPSLINTNSTTIFYEVGGSNRGLCLFASSASQLTSATTVLPIGAWSHVVVCRNSSGNLSSFVNGTRLDTKTSNTSTIDFSGAIINRYFPSSGGHLFGYTSSLRLIKGSTPYDPTSTTITVPTAPVTNITNTSLLLNFTNGGIIDTSMSNDLETVGNAQISTTQSKFGGASMYFDGNDKVTLPYTQNFSLGTTYTIEGWVYPTTVSGYQRIFDIVNSATSSPAFLDVALNGTALVSEIRTTNGGGVTTISGGTVSANTWAHFALSVSAGSAKLFLNGTQVGSTTTFSALPDQNFVGIGGIGNSLTIDYLTGYIDDLRISKGLARYTANFTAPVAPFNGFGD